MDKATNNIIIGISLWKKILGKITGVNGNLLTIEFDKPVVQNEVAYAIVDESRLKCEVIRIRGNRAEAQVFEDTQGLQVGGDVEFTGKLLSVELGPGLLTQIYDGLQNPLPQLAEKSGFFLQRGMYLRALDAEKKWDYTPVAKMGDTLKASDTIGTVPEGIFTHRIMVPFGLTGKLLVEEVVSAGLLYHRSGGGETER